MLKSVWVEGAVVGLEAPKAASLTDSAKAGVLGAHGTDAVGVMAHHALDVALKIIFGEVLLENNDLGVEDLFGRGGAHFWLWVGMHGGLIVEV